MSHQHTHSHEHRHKEGERREIIELTAAALLLLSAVLCRNMKLPALLMGAAAWLSAGRSVLAETLHALRERELFDESFLMSIASLDALCIGDAAEAAAVMLFYRVGEALEEMAEGHSRRNITALMDLRPDHATVWRNGAWQQVDSEELAVGDKLRLVPGERIAADCRLLEGSALLDYAALTGEALPCSVSSGDMLLSGSVVLDGTLTARVEQTAQDSTVGRILRLTEEAQEHKGSCERFITRFARRYTPIVCAAALLLAVVPPVLHLGQWGESLHRACVLLVISCPCALVISVPLGFFAGIGGASRQGILIKGGSEMERLAKVSIAAFDKTGTLTQGSFRVNAVHAADGDKDGLLRLAAAIEADSPHPLAAAIRNAAATRTVESTDTPPVSSVRELPGRGLRGEYRGAELLAGNLRLMDEHGISIPPEWRSAAIHLAWQNSYLGSLRLGDQLKPEAAAALRELRGLGIRRCMILSGDQRNNVLQTAAQLGIEPAEIYAELLPDDKLRCAEQLMQEEQTLLFAGDGLNDAPLLARADVGVAMGGLGADATIEAADAVIMNDDLRNIPAAISHARRTLRIVRQNIIITLLIKTIILLLGMFGLASMWLAVFADVGVTVLTILNSGRALHCSAAAKAKKTQ